MRNPGQSKQTRPSRVIPLALLLLAAILCVALFLFLASSLDLRGAPSPTGAVTSTPASIAAAPTSTSIVGQPSEVPSPAPGQTATPLPTVGNPVAAAGSLGDATFDYPVQLTVGQDQVATFEIIPEVPQASIIPVNPPSGLLRVQASSSDAARTRLPYQLTLFPIMSAELGPDESDVLSIKGSGSSSQQPIDPASKTIWSWTLHPKQSGSARITLRVMGQVMVQGANYQREIIDDTRVVPIQDRSLPERIAEGLAGNLPLIFGAGGPLALILAWLTFRANQKKKTE